MALKNTQSSYGAISRLFHWLVALLVFGLIAAGLYMTRQTPSPDIFKLYGLHKSVGITVLFLAVLRLIWRLANKTPKMLGLDRPWEKYAAHTVHGLMYLCLFLMPLSGWVMSSAAGIPVRVFDLFTLPDLVAAGNETRKLAQTVHEYTAYTLIFLILAHSGAALMHHFVKKDRTLVRMIKGE